MSIRPQLTPLAAAVFLCSCAQPPVVHRAAAPDVPSWKMTRRIPAGDGVYNLAVTRDGKYMVMTSKRGKSASIPR